MCICVNCYYVDVCQTYHAVEEQHQQSHLTNKPSFNPIKADINVNIRPKNDYIEIAWDIVNCESFLEETGKWLRLCPGSPVPS